MNNSWIKRCKRNEKNELSKESKRFAQQIKINVFGKAQNKIRKQKSSAYKKQQEKQEGLP